MENDELLNPGDWLVIKVKVPEEWDEPMHKDLFFDGLFDPTYYDTEIVGIERKKK